MSQLKRAVSLPLITFYGLGNILGAGIYVLVGRVAGNAGDFVIISFLFAAITAGFTAFTYAELVSRYPVSAGSAIYVHHGFGKRFISRAVGLLIILTGLVSASTMARGLVGYMSVFIDLPEWLVISLVLIVLGSLAIWGIVESVRTAMVITIIEVGGLLLILFIGRSYFGLLPERIGGFFSPASVGDWNGIMIGAFLAFYAYVGFEDMVNVAEEVKDSQRNMPLAVLISLGVATVLYLGISTLAILVISPTELGSSNAPLADMYTKITGEAPYLISVISLFAIINGALVQIIMASRVFYGMSSQKWMPAWMGVVHPKTHTPINSTILVVILILLVALALPLETLARVTSFCLLIIFALVNLSLFLIKLRGPGPAGVFTVPLFVPVLGMISCLILLIA
jgi:APA family basic amino acid/polyamine antiporter